MLHLGEYLSSCTLSSNMHCFEREQEANSENMEEDTAPKRVYISLPKKYMAGLSKNYELEHGLFVKGLNPYLNEGYVQEYFREWGNVTGCKIKKAGKKAAAYVRFSTEDEADIADWNGPHVIGGAEVTVKRVVSPKMEGQEEEEVATVVSHPRPRRSMGLGYILEDAQWLDEELADD